MNQFLTCEETRQLLDRYLAGQTERGDTQLVAEHLEACASCLQVVVTLVGFVGRRTGLAGATDE
ncbi:MAG: hypothetical protein DMD33_11520 [Gemmatimonadetes bacterium]|nr:MAG: hypothetical protein DMD33_11520 [Gemmatimonadota bacterium]PYO72847.1 MAG: hypothetical protein DMD67_16470 [Gemmatimonadota bacterium]TLY47513.1 MAG: zf-HC2 domain-containing protein [Gemmatimonadota bacterium]